LGLGGDSRAAWEDVSTVTGFQQLGKLVAELADNFCYQPRLEVQLSIFEMWVGSQPEEVQFLWVCFRDSHTPMKSSALESGNLF